MSYNNWILRKHKNNIEVLSHEYLPFYQNYLKELGIIINSDLKKASTFINWDAYKNTEEFNYDIEGEEAKVTYYLMHSPLINCDFITLDFGYDHPIIKVKTNYFISNWLDFITGAHYETTLVCNSGKYFIEFVKGYKFKCNFQLKPY